jgi:hypothetical protein
MEWYKFKQKHGELQNPKGQSFVYVISQYKKGPFKVGLTKADLYRRMDDYQLCFIDFYVHMVVVFMYDDIFTAETYIHDNVVEGVMRYPGTNNKTEWFDVPLGKIFDAFQDMVKRSNINPVYGYKVGPERITYLREYQQQDGVPPPYKTRAGREIKPTEKGSTHSMYFDNNRRYDGVNFSLYADGIASVPKPERRSSRRKKKNW